MTILLLFNETTTISVQDILTFTKIERDLCLTVLFGLLKTQILKSSQVDASQLAKENGEESIQSDFIIEVNDNFRALVSIFLRDFIH